MSGRRVWTMIGAVVFSGVGFAAAGFGSAWMTRQHYAEPWHKMQLEHQGIEGKPSRTRIIFENPKLAVQAIELMRSGEGKPTLARISLRDGDELALEYGDTGPTTLTGPDGARARFESDGGKTRVTFLSPDGTEVGSKRLTVPIQLLTSRGHTSDERDSRLASLWRRVSSALVAEASAKEAEDAQITATREIVLGLDLRPVGKDAGVVGSAQIEASCAGFACVPSTREVAVPGVHEVRVMVSGSAKKSALPSAQGKLSPFEDEARAERKAARSTLPDLAEVISTLGVTAMACESLKLAAPICVREFGVNAGVAGGAMSSVRKHVIEVDSNIIAQRAEQLFYEEAARASLDKETHLDVCVVREGFARVCAGVDGRPFGAEPMAKVSRVLELRRGVGGSLPGSFVMTQSDGADCKFSPSPRTTGSLRLTFDNERNTITASATTNERGSRPNMQCSLGTANMGWSQSYSISATQSFTKQELGGGGKLPIRLKGTMSGSGNYSFSNCRTGGGASANCPPGKGDAYNYPVELTGSIDLDNQTGSGQIIVQNAPLPTQGTWRTPAEVKP